MELLIKAHISKGAKKAGYAMKNGNEEERVVIKNKRA